MGIVDECITKLDEISKRTYIDSAYTKEYPGPVDYYSIFLVTEDGEIELINGLYWDEIDNIFNVVCAYILKSREDY